MDSFDKFKDTHMDSFENFKDNLEQQEHVPNVPAGPTSGNERWRILLTGLPDEGSMKSAQ